MVRERSASERVTVRARGSQRERERNRASMAHKKWQESACACCEAAAPRRIRAAFTFHASALLQNAVESGTSFCENPCIRASLAFEGGGVLIGADGERHKEKAPQGAQAIKEEALQDCGPQGRHPQVPVLWRLRSPRARQDPELLQKQKRVTQTCMPSLRRDLWPQRHLPFVFLHYATLAMFLQPFHPPFVFSPRQGPSTATPGTLGHRSAQAAVRRRRSTPSMP